MTDPSLRPQVPARPREAPSKAMTFLSYFVARPGQAPGRS